jgi:sterol desaturase/sphingolipid hydroxylase (fatty acid hydroxylase superfamily)
LFYLHHLILHHIVSLQILLFATALTGLWLAEQFYTAEPILKKWKHTSINFFFLFSAIPIQLIGSVFLMLTVKWVTLHHFGIAYLFDNPSNIWIKYIGVFLVLDLLDYCYHVLAHKVPTLWKFHLVHHTDLNIDVSSNLREHPGESVLRNMFSILWIIITGASLELVFIRQIFQTLSNIIAHTSFTLPDKAAKILGWVFITPNLHHVHHHFKLPYTDKNYGDVLSIWDRLFGTYAELSADKITYGLDSHYNKELHLNYKNLIQIPFRKAY